MKKIEKKKIFLDNFGKNLKPDEKKVNFEISGN